MTKLHAVHEALTAIHNGAPQAKVGVTPKFERAAIVDCPCGHTYWLRDRGLADRTCCPVCQRTVPNAAAVIRQHWDAHANHVFELAATRVEARLGIKRLTDREFASMVTAFREWAKERIAADADAFRTRYEAADPALISEFVSTFTAQNDPLAHAPARTAGDPPLDDATRETAILLYSRVSRLRSVPNSVDH
jgi:hypothetical protein